MRTIERIYQRPQRPNMVGDGFRVFNFIPGGGISQQRISPFLMLDFNPAYHFSATEKPRGVGAHPHKGFETVTIAYKGAVAHNDSAGNSGVINPGDVQWMTAGGGLLHKEYHEENFARKGGEFEMVQLWVNLPKSDKNAAPGYQTLLAEGMGKMALDNNSGSVEVIAGEVNGVKGPAKTFTQVNLFNLKLEKDAAFTCDLPASHNTAMLIIKGEATVNGERAGEHSFVLFNNDGTTINVEADEQLTALIMSGEPINEPIVSYGPFVMNTREEIMQAMEEFQEGKYGVLS